MNITVVGSYREKGSLLLRNKNEFIEACEAIGEKLADWGHRLIVPHPDNDETAEGYALKGFRQKAKHRYHKCTAHKGEPDLKAHFDAVERSDAVILIGGHSGTYASGLVALRRRKQVIPIPAFGGSASDLCTISEIESMLVDEIQNLNVGGNNWLIELTDAVKSILNSFPRILIIHGRGDSGEELRNKIIEKSNETGSVLDGIAEPVIMDLTGKGAVTVPNVFEHLASQVSAAIAIVTADDIGGFARSDNKQELKAMDLKLAARARENVWVEVGWFWGRLGRHRIFLWLKDKIELPSDLTGAASTREESIEDAWKSIKSFIVHLKDGNSSEMT